MILTATSPDADSLVVYEWKINGEYFPSATDPAITQSIEADVVDGDVVTVRALNDCGNWSVPLSITIGEEEDDDDSGISDDAIFYLIIFAVAYAVFMGDK